MTREFVHTHTTPIFISVSLWHATLPCEVNANFEAGLWEQPCAKLMSEKDEKSCCSWVTRTNTDPHQTLTDLWDPWERQQEGMDCRSGPRTTALVSLCGELKGWMAALDSAQSFWELHTTRSHLKVSEVCWTPRRLSSFWKWDHGTSASQAFFLTDNLFHVDFVRLFPLNFSPLAKEITILTQI